MDFTGAHLAFSSQLDGIMVQYVHVDIDDRDRRRRNNEHRRREKANALRMLANGVKPKVIMDKCRITSSTMSTWKKQ